MRAAVGVRMAEPEIVYESAGFCPVCEQATEFKAWAATYRDHLLCMRCHSIPRERALAIALQQSAPNWRRLAIHESSPAERGLSARLKLLAPRYVASQYLPAQPAGAIVDGARNENLERQTFGDAEFDLVLSLDVMEHVNKPDLCMQEIHRTLKPGGYYLFTTPTFKQLAETRRRALYKDDVEIEHLAKPEYHDSPVDPAGSLVTFHFGYDLPALIGDWAPFDVRVLRFHEPWHGVIGDFTEVYMCRKRGGGRDQRMIIRKLRALLARLRPSPLPPVSRSGGP
jgi:SAM-dependent methyltransferase